MIIQASSINTGSLAAAKNYLAEHQLDFMQNHPLYTAPETSAATDSKPANRFDMLMDQINEQAQEDAAALDPKTEAAMEITKRLTADGAVEHLFRRMESICKKAGEFEEESVNNFKDKTAEKAYYQDLLDSDDSHFNASGRYRLSGYQKNDAIDRDAIQKAIEEVQKEIDDIIAESDSYYKKASLSFEYTGTEMMIAKPGLVMANRHELIPLAMGEKSIFSGVVRTEDNFLEQSEITMKSIEDKLEKLKDIKTTPLTKEQDQRRLNKKEVLKYIDRLFELETAYHGIENSDHLSDEERQRLSSVKYPVGFDFYA